MQAPRAVCSNSMVFRTYAHTQSLQCNVAITTTGEDDRNLAVSTEVQEDKDLFTEEEATGFAYSQQFLGDQLDALEANLQDKIQLLAISEGVGRT